MREIGVRGKGLKKKQKDEVNEQHKRMLVKEIDAGL
jgi:hypothetical protein